MSPLVEPVTNLEIDYEDLTPHTPELQSTKWDFCPTWNYLRTSVIHPQSNTYLVSTPEPQTESVSETDLTPVDNLDDSLFEDTQLS